MSYRIVGPDGVWRVCGDGALKKRIHVLVDRRFGSGTLAGLSMVEARDVILGHAYLEFDEWRCAEERYRKERAKRCREMLEGLKVRLERGELQQEGLEGQTGKPELTPDKLTGHSLRLLDLSDDWLLLRIERHPSGGSNVVLDQHWLYSRHGRKLYLLHLETIQYPKTGDVKVQFGDGPWQKADEGLQTDFKGTVEKILGAEGVNVLEKAVQLQETGLWDPPPEIFTKCKEITGTDHQAEERKHLELRERHYLKKYGPRQPSGKPGIALVPDAGIRLGMVVERDDPDQRKEPDE